MDSAPITSRSAALPCRSCAHQRLGAGDAEDEAQFAKLGTSGERGVARPETWCAQSDTAARDRDVIGALSWRSSARGSEKCPSLVDTQYADITDATARRIRIVKTEELDLLRPSASWTRARPG